MANVGTSLEGAYNAMPPPGFGALKRRRGKKAYRGRYAREGAADGSAGFGFKSIKRGLKKAGRGVKKAGKAGYKLNKRIVKTSIKVSVKPIKVVAKAGKFALRAMAKLAAKPIIYVVNKLAGRRAKYLAFQKRGTTALTLTDKKAGGQYALQKLGKAGPVGKLAVKILKFTGGVTAGDELSGVVSNTAGWEADAAACGMTGAEIAAAAMTIVAATTKLMKSLNKPGEAPANPQTATTLQDVTTETQPVLESDNETAEADASTEGDDREAIAGRVRRKLRRRKLKRAIVRRLAKLRGIPTPPPPPPHPGLRRG